MARRKNAPDLVKVKCGVAERLRDLRNELFGDRGGPELARQLGLPVRTWYNYEAGVTVPAEVILRFIELTSVEPIWLLHGTSPKFRDRASGGVDGPPSHLASVGTLLRTALERLERGEPFSSPESSGPYDASDDGQDGPSVPAEELVLLPVDEQGRGPITSDDGPRFIAARLEWQAAERDRRCLHVVDDEMAPLVAAGAYVAYSDGDAAPDRLDGRLVVAWLGEESPLVRWYQSAGACALLRAENSSTNPQTRLVDLESAGLAPRFRVVSWISTPR